MIPHRLLYQLDFYSGSNGRRVMSVHYLRLVVYSLTVLLSAYQVAPFPEGAPDGACQTMIPNHATHKPQTRPAPFTITVDKTGYVAGDSIKRKFVDASDFS
jgi:Reeler domain